MAVDVAVAVAAARTCTGAPMPPGSLEAVVD